MSVPVVVLGETVEVLLATGVEEHDFDLFLINRHHDDVILHPNGGEDCLLESFGAVAVLDGGFSDCRISQKDRLANIPFH